MLGTFNPSWVVEGVLTKGSMVLLAGEPGVGKSFVSYHMALAVALGRPFLGHFPTVQHRVMYLDEENSQADLTQYMRWLWQGMGAPDIKELKQWFLHSSFQLGGATWQDRLLVAAKAFKPGLVIVDTATSALSIKDENDNGEASSAIGYLRRLQREVGGDPSILVLKHAKVSDEGIKVRGASAWKGSTDGTLYHLHTPGKPPKDGWRMTQIKPGKVRAFGVKQTILISPVSVGEGDGKGWILKAEFPRERGEL